MAYFPRQRDKYGLPDWPVRFVPTRHKAFLNVNECCVDIDPSLETLPESALLFIKLHELAHLYNNNPPGMRIMQLEINCDKIAADVMIRTYGYSMTQVLGAMDQALGNSTEERERMRAVQKYLAPWNAH